MSLKSINLDSFETKLKCIIPGCNFTGIPVVVFSEDQSFGGTFSQICESGDNCVYIWSSEMINTVTVPLVYVMLPDIV